MDKKYGIYITFCLVTGAMFGSAFTPVIQNDVLAILGGALAGFFIGWFMVAAVHQSSARKMTHSEKTDDH